MPAASSFLDMNNREVWNKYMPPMLTNPGSNSVHEGAHRRYPMDGLSCEESAQGELEWQNTWKHV